MDNDGGLQAFPIFALGTLEEAERDGEFDVVAVGRFLGACLALGRSRRRFVVAFDGEGLGVFVGSIRKV